MSAPTVTRAQIEAHLSGLSANFKSDTPLVLLRGNAKPVPAEVLIAGRPVDLLASDSPLEIRARAAEERTRPLVVVTGCDSAALGKELEAKAFHLRVLNVDRWQTLARMFGAETVTRALSNHAAVADVLIESKPTSGYRPVATHILDLDTALAALVRVALGAPSDSILRLMEWAEKPQAAYAVQQMPDAVLNLALQHLRDQHGDAADFVLAVLRAGEGAELMALALAAGPIHHEDAEEPVAAFQLESKLGQPGLGAEVYRTASRAAGTRIERAVANDPVAQWCSGGDALLTGLGGSAQAHRSPYLRSGFEQRLEQAAQTLVEMRSAPASLEAEASVALAIDRARQHRLAAEEGHRVDRLDMAARLIRHHRDPLAVAGTLDGAVQAYIADGGWFDAARVSVSQQDTNGDVAAVLAEVAAEADARAHERNKQVAHVLKGAGYPMAGNVIGVEHILERVVGPTAADAPVLVLVLDGMGWPSFIDVVRRVEAQGWVTLRNDKLPQAPAAVAVLPTVTEVSRTSLLCGEIRDGNKESERRAFGKHPSLVEHSAKSKPPQLFHKTDLRRGGIDALPNEVLDVIGDESRRVVGVVLNNIDERLKDVAAPPRGWDLDALTPLREVLSAARRAGRAIVMTADHGHILERGTEHRAGNGGGERWRRNDGPAFDDEIEVNGPRVVVSDKTQTALLPWKEQLRYSASRNGYHGGLTPAEAIVPVAVLWSGLDLLDGWEPAPVRPPSWWQFDAPGSVAEPEPQPAPRPKKKPKPAPQTEQLFALEAAEEPPVASSDVWTSAVVSHALIAPQIERLRLDTAQVELLLRLMDSTGGTAVSEDRLADATGIARMRIGRTITQLQRLFNIDGYGIIETSANGEVRFNRELLETQLGL